VDQFAEMVIENPDGVLRDLKRERLGHQPFEVLKSHLPDGAPKSQLSPRRNVVCSSVSGSIESVVVEALG